MLTLYSMPSSGNSYKVRLLLAHLAIPFRVIETEYDGGKELTKTPEFRAKNPHGRVPLLELEDGRLLSESNAILLYLGERHAVCAGETVRAAPRCINGCSGSRMRMKATSPCAARSSHIPERAHLRTPEVLGPLLAGGNHCLGVMETQLKQTPYLAGDELHRRRHLPLRLHAFSRKRRV